jgi:hypothetical protein
MITMVDGTAGFGHLLFSAPAESLFSPHFPPAVHRTGCSGGGGGGK